jgi:molecular chaperone DnaK
MSRIVGIDFGTTKSVAAVLEGKYPTVISDREGRQSIPSVVLVSEEQEFFVGWEAREHRGRYQTEYISINSIKRALGQRGEKTWGWLKAHPQAVAALILGRLKIELEDYFGEEVSKAVIAMPAHFDINQRWAVKQAAEIAGFEVVRMVNEATAAALSFNIRRPRDETVLVVDFGGGTLDVSVLELGEDFCEVKATAGDGLLGGDDFDLLIADYVLKSVRAQFPGFKDWNPLQHAVVSEASVRAKIELSAARSSQIYLPGIIEYPPKTYHSVDLVIDRETFDRLSEGLLARTETVLNRVLKDAGRTAASVNQVLLTGGTSRIPAVREVVRKVLEREPVTGVNPLTCVAEGAAVLAGVLSGGKRNYLLMDTYPNSLSVSTQYGAAKRIIERNTSIPTRQSETFSTNKDYQSSVDVDVYEGESAMAAHNSLVGSVRLVGIPPAPRGKPQIEVTFDIDHNGILNVSAKDLSTKRSAAATMTAPSRLTSEQLEVIQGVVAMEMKKVRERLARETEKAEAEARKTEALSCVGKIESLLAECGEELAEQQVSTLRAGCDVVRDYLERGAPADDLLSLIAALKGEFDKALSSNVARNVKVIFEDPALTLWADSAFAALDGRQPLVDSMRDFGSQYGPFLDGIEADLRRASNADDVCDAALAGLQDSTGARCCLGLVISHFAGHVSLNLDKVAPRSEGVPRAEPLLMLLLFRELLRDKSVPRRLAAAGMFSEICQVKHLVALIEQVGHGADVADEKLRECLRRIPAEELYEYFRSAGTERRSTLFSDPAIRARLRDALIEMLRVKGPEDRTFILHSLTGVADSTSTPALLETLKAADEASVRSLVVKLLPSLRDPRVLRPLLELTAGSSPSVRADAKSALEECRDLMDERWAAGLSAPEWYAYYSAASPLLKKHWLAQDTVRPSLRKALCAVLPEKSVAEQMAILVVLEVAADAESIPDFLGLLMTIEQEPCCRLISILSALRDRRTIVPLIKLLLDERSEVRDAANAALAGYKELLDPETERFIRITKAVMERGWPPSLSDRFFLPRYVKLHGEFRGIADDMKRRLRA